jgi:hypothetical protein
VADQARPARARRQPRAPGCRQCARPPPRTLRCGPARPRRMASGRPSASSRSSPPYAPSSSRHRLPSPPYPPPPPRAPPRRGASVFGRAAASAQHTVPVAAADDGADGAGGGDEDPLGREERDCHRRASQPAALGSAQQGVIQAAEGALPRSTQAREHTCTRTPRASTNTPQA